MDSFEALDFAFRPQYAEDYGLDAHAELIEAEHPCIFRKGGADRCPLGHERPSCSEGRPTL